MNGVRLNMPNLLTNNEMNLCVMILYIAHKYPEVITAKKSIHCSEIRFPGTVASKFCDVPNTKELVTIPGETFIKIIDAAMQIEIICELTNNKGQTESRTYPFLPVLLIRDATDPAVIFTAEPQCFFVEEINAQGKQVRQMTPKGELLQFMRDWLKENPQ